MTPEQRQRESDRAEEPKPTPAEERGERLDTGKAIARGGKESGPVPGAEPSEPSRDPPRPENTHPRPDRP